ncbi:MAG: bifunctional helix-turn-helix transcriptional regulator/GNAT family N-acetyltransferase [Chloroflexota bacterium]
MSNLQLENEIEAVRNFNRFYTREIGVLREGLLHSPYSLTEARIIFELGHRLDVTASDLCFELGLNAGYISRIIAKLAKENLLIKTKSKSDGRKRVLHLTDEGQAAFNLLNNRSIDEVGEMLLNLPQASRHKLIDAMATIGQILNKSFKYAEPFYLRPHQAGDMGWVVFQHGLLYVQEYNWNHAFEALVAEICAAFLHNFQPEWERCWIAEMKGERVGSVFCVREDEETAKLRLLIVHPKARGLGLGTHLVRECIRFAREKKYKKLTLWTNDVLGSARKIYQTEGFILVDSEKHFSFGQHLVGENWDLML